MKNALAIWIGAATLAWMSAAAAQSPADRPLPAQTPVLKPKPKLQPAPEVPPPPPMVTDPEGSFEPQVTIRRNEKQTVEEYRIRGRLYMVKVTPTHGVPYYLIDENGRGDFTRQDSYDTGTRPPMWVIHTW